MNFKALRRPHERGLATTQLTRRSAHRPLRAPGAPGAPGAPRVIGRWTVAGDGRLELVWELGPEQPRRHLINRNRGSHA